MDNNFVLKLIWKDDKIINIDDENLSKKEFEKFFFNTEKSNKEKLVFSKKNVGKEIKQNYIYALVMVLFVLILMSLWEPSSDFAIKIASVIIIGVSLSFIGLILSPFIINKNIYFEKDKIGQERLSKENVLGSISTILNFKNIVEIKLIKDTLNSYFLIAEQIEGKISEKAIILLIETENINLIAETKKILQDFIEKEIVESEVK